MAEGTEHMHHGASKSDLSAFVLPLSILLAAIIVGYSMMSAATTVNTGFMEFAKNVGNLAPAANNGGNVAPTPDPNQGNLAPTPSKTMAELAATDFGGKWGSDSAPIVMVEYSDFQCPFCRAWINNSESQIQTNFVDKGKVQIIYKDFPLSFHPLSGPYANAARCAKEQGKFNEMHDKIFAEQTKIDPTGATVSSVTNDDIKKWAKDIGLNETSFNSCFDSKKYQSSIDATYAEGVAMGVSGTPSFIVGKRGEKGQLIVGAQPYATFEAALNALASN